jgi:uncharacterized protein (UPF0332 family)
LTEAIEKYISAAENDIKQVDMAFRAGNYRRGLAILYYVIFYYVKALLLTKGLTYKSHGETIGAFRREFVKTGDFPVEFGEFLQELFTARQGGDYKLIEYGEDYASKLREKADEFIALSKRFLSKEV